MRYSFGESLSAFRGLAALLVSLCHLEQIFLRPYTKLFSPYASLLAQGSVMIFFVISGYSITASISGLIDKPNPCYEYFIRRFCRVMPPLITAILLMFLLFSLAPHFFASGNNEFIKQTNLARAGLFFDTVKALGALLFLNGFITATPEANGPLWSLSYEVWLYVIFFGISYAFYNRAKKSFIIAIATYFAMVFFDKSGNWLFLKYSLIWYLGAACRIIFQSKNSTLMIYIRLTRNFLILSLLTSLFIGYRYVESGMKIDISTFNVCVGISFSTYLMANLKQPLLKKTMISQSLVKAADFSYTLYLIHFPLYLFIFGITQTQSVLRAEFLCMTYLFTVLCAYSLSRFTENRSFFLTLMRTGQ